MSKLKLALILTAIGIGIGGAFATKEAALCEAQTQYYKYGTTYFPAGIYGYDYVCLSAAGNCTYYLTDPYNPNSFAPCRMGQFTWLYAK
jgi:hypothetical protein